jgi:hypothetical protein
MEAGEGEDRREGHPLFGGETERGKGIIKKGRGGGNARERGVCRQGEGKGELS